MNPDVTVGADLKSVVAQCKPGQTKTISVKVSMGADGKVTLGAANQSEEYAEGEAPASKKKKPAKAMDAIKSMYS